MLGLENKMLSMMNKQGKGINISNTKILLTFETLLYLIGTLSLSYRKIVQDSSSTDQGA